VTNCQVLFFICGYISHFIENQSFTSLDKEKKLLDIECDKLSNGEFNFRMTKTTKDLSKKEKLNPKVLLKIKESLKAKGLKPVQLARKLNYSDSWASYLMRGQRSLTINQLIKIAEILDIDPASLLPGTNPQQKPAFDEYIRNIVREEIEKAVKKK